MAKEKGKEKTSKVTKVASNTKIVFNSGSKKKRTAIGSSKQSRPKHKDSVRNRRGR